MLLFFFELLDRSLLRLSFVFFDKRFSDGYRPVVTRLFNECSLLCITLTIASFELASICLDLSRSRASVLKVLLIKIHSN